MSITLSQERLEFTQIDEQTREDLRALKPFVKENLPIVLEKFYDLMSRYETPKSQFTDREHMQAAARKQLDHWLHICDASFGPEYLERVSRIWKIHANLPIESFWFVNAYGFLLNEMSAAIYEHFRPKGFAAFKADEGLVPRYCSAIAKVTIMELDLGLEFYTKETEGAAKAKLLEFADTFEDRTSTVLEDVFSNINQVQETATAMAKIAEATADQSTSVSASADETTQNVSTVANSTGELSTSVREIASQVTHSTRIADDAVYKAQETNDTMRSLSNAADKIGEVVSMISDIAEQTNLLALNATIESARAGDAGKGFAVVASEVKSLATQTAKATEDIGAQIQEMQAIAQKSVSAIEEIGTTINDMSQVATAINAAVEEQSAVTSSITHSTEEAAQRTKDVATTIAEVLDGANRTDQASTQVVDAAKGLDEQTRTLKQEIDNLLTTVRAA